MRRNFIAAILAGCLALAACGTTDPGLTADRSRELVDVEIAVTEDTMPTPSSVPVNPNNAMIDFGTNKEPQPYDEFLQIALADIQDYWRVTYPEVYGTPYIELGGGIWASYPGREGNPIPEAPNGCRGRPDDQYIAQGNAFYCGGIDPSTGQLVFDYMAYDDFQLIPDQVEANGQVAVGVIFAHEFGHAIQARVDKITNDATVFGEQQADCFAGSWSAHVQRGESASLVFGDDEVRAGLTAMIEIADPLIITDENGQPISIDVLQDGAHGTAFDRVGAFEHGFLGGAVACMGLETTPLPLLNIKFDTTDTSDIERGGNTPYDGDETTDPVIPTLQTLLVEDLTRFWTGAVDGFVAPAVVAYEHDGPYPECDDVDESAFPFGAFYCPSTNSILYDDGFARALFRTYGDFSVGYIISNAWSDAAQTAIGSSLTGEQRVLINECLTGAWTQDIIPNDSGTQPFVISPGDLDEAVQTALILGTEDISDNQMGSAFEKIEFFRAGVLGGVAECNSRITG